MHIERLRLRDVGPFDDVTIEFPKGSDPKLADVYLLTGPNGTGKSTILYALAAAIAGNAASLGRDLLSERMRSRRAMAALEGDDGRSLAVAPRDYEDDLDLHVHGPFDGGLGMSTRFDDRGPLARLAPSMFPTSYGDIAGEYRDGSAFGETVTFEWASFAYAGTRSVSDVAINSIKEPKQSPFENSLSFAQTADTQQLAQWITSQNFRRLKAKEAGNLERADYLARSIRDIESCVAQIVADPDFGFVVTDEDDEVRVRWRGVPVKLGLLPDGLKSIVSWIADLLMRLERIPWEDATPVLQRHFLLLLDEIDIHLHPAWQRKVLPLAQRLFPNAQIIASTHSPFVVGSVDDARIITLGFRDGVSIVEHVSAPQIGRSYSTVLRSIFGIASEFDVDTEEQLRAFHKARQRLLQGDEGARADVERIAATLESRSEELREIIAIELIQLRRQQNLRAAP